MTTPDIAGLCKKLRFSETCISTLAAEVDRLTDTLERQAAENKRLREALTDLLADECDGDPIARARAALTGENND